MIVIFVTDICIPSVTTSENAVVRTVRNGMVPIIASDNFEKARPAGVPLFYVWHAHDVRNTIFSIYILLRVYFG